MTNLFPLLSSIKFHFASTLNIIEYELRAGIWSKNEANTEATDLATRLYYFAKFEQENQDSTERKYEIVLIWNVCSRSLQFLFRQN